MSRSKPSQSSIGQRKLDHLRLALETSSNVRDSHVCDRRDFDELRLVHRALPELNFAEIDMSVEFLGKKLSAPLMISAMTGGPDEELVTINRRLAEAAEYCGIAMSVGSERIAIEPGALSAEEQKQAEESFRLRSYAPRAVLLANLGAVQLNYGMGIETCEQAVELLAADGLYLHLNPLQELIQPEGQTNFAGLLEKIGKISRALSVPVLLKEVGCGLSASDIMQGYQQGIRYFDVAGAGGTSFARIEHERKFAQGDSYERSACAGDRLGLLFENWGNSTVEALRMAQPLNKKHPDMHIIASGGVQTGIDIAKSVILGATLAGMTKRLLVPALESTQAVIDEIEAVKTELAATMFLVGAGDIASLRSLVLSTDS